MPDPAPQTTGAKALQTFVARIAVSAFGILAGIVVARTLGPDGKGVYSGLQLLLALPVALTGGAGAAITYLLTKERRAIAEIFPALAVLFAACTLLCGAAACIYAALHGWNAETIAFAASVPAAIVLAWQPSYYAATGRLRTLNAQTIAQSAATLAGVMLTCAAFRWGAPGALAAWVVCAYGCAAAVVAGMVADGARLHVRDLRAQVRSLAQFGSQSALNTGLGLLNYRIDSLVLAAFLGVASFGVYSIAVNVGEMLFMLVRPLNMAVAREIGGADLERSGELTAYTIRFGVTLALLCAIVAFAIAPPAIHLIYGDRFDAAALPLRLLLPGIVAFAGAGTFASFFMFQLARPLLVAYINLVMIAVQLAGCFVLVPHYAMAGAAVASSIAYIAGAIANTMLFCRATGIRASQIWLPRPRDLRRIAQAASELLQSMRRPAPPLLSGGVLVTGARGGVASLIRRDLARRYSLLLSDRAKPKDLSPKERFARADIRSVRAMRRLARGMRAIVHLAAVSKEAEFETIVQSNVRGLHAVLEAARLEGVKRVVFASTGHLMGFYSRETYLDERAAPRPDTAYAVSKGFGELLCRYYADKFGLEIVCIRIGHVSAQPEYDIDKHIWISPRDLTRLIGAAIEHEPVHFEIVYGVSANPQRFWSLQRARKLGYEPIDGAEQAPPAKAGAANAHVKELLQGDSFAANGFTGSVAKVLRGVIE